ncbi:hypothetical protein CIHG_09607 [Coccidioides immitis H538.4]|uniref:Uncharacterized protein n=1 Tax=Coccidioides immitis H538.4 TaxID=396776 RepID=A0A0J8S4R4_COCIT|nr:hypothetical protein CIHG_09607 [Coccidioides immitis H538.4]
MLECLIIHHIIKTSWFNKSIIKLPCNHHYDALCSLELKIRHELQQYKQHKIQKLKDSYIKSLQKSKKYSQGSKSELFSQIFFKKSCINQIIVICPVLLNLIKTKQYGMLMIQQLHKKTKLLKRMTKWQEKLNTLQATQKHSQSESLNMATSNPTSTKHPSVLRPP